ncbi:MAG: 23S rRNA pseudouridine(2605) synthase RluB [Candidatus Arsenophonus melophagi]|nr:23S rRNA pseudouridine(2605) synthase RluB [Candidatus Arsenophonus melophagi]
MRVKKKRSEKLQKVLARCGYGSRRIVENLIQSGRIRVDGQLAVLGDRIEIKSNTKIHLDGILLKIQKAGKIICRVLAYYKPEGELCTHHDPAGRPTVFNRLPELTSSRWISIGRLDVNTSGLLLFTTDGELGNRLMHPSHNIEREYAVRVFGEINDTKIHQLTKGIPLEDGKASFKLLQFRGGDGMNKWFHVTVTEGRHHLVRRLWKAVDIQVSRMIRVRYGDIFLPKGLPRGGWIELGLSQINYLRHFVGLNGERSSSILIEQNRRQIKTTQIRRAIKRHTNVSSMRRRT